LGGGSVPLLRAIFSSLSDAPRMSTQSSVSGHDAARVLESAGAFSSYVGYTTSLGSCFDITPPANSRSETDVVAGASMLAYGVTD